MNCYAHPERAAVAYCRTCGKALCAECQRFVQGTIFCGEHAPQPNPPAAPAGAPPGASPALAFLLGFIPGVGAIYNGQYVKGLIHVVILGVLISIVSSGAAGEFGPLFGLLIALWFFYMAFEAYHTAARRQRGEPVDEFSGLLPAGGRTAFPAGPVVLIALGTLFLLHNLELLEMREILRYWPVFLIALGVYMLYARLAADRRERTRWGEGGAASGGEGESR
ncbi:MAG: B-box zinc finger protein [Bryobacterales bacterium]|nr:B-box zinc finger protein [Bryobacteraceae bacterium]MDW8354686.1 B-box zinc finger protein [Bryobacterales bacterium]